MLRPTLALLVLLGASACQTTDPMPDTDDYAGEMRHQHDGDTPVASGATAGAEALDVTREEVTYATVGGQAVTGTLVAPRGASEGLPGLLVVHEWWGLNDNVRDMAARYANEGYRVLAVDLYGGQVAETPDGAMALMQAAFGAPAETRANMEQAYAFLTERGAARVGVVGWCFGGNQALRAAQALPAELDATVIFYGGNPPSDADALRPLQMPVLALYGGEDSSIPTEAVEAFDAALAEAGVRHEVHVYPGAGHAFANPSGQNYVPAAADNAWRRATAFLAANLK